MAWGGFPARAGRAFGALVREPFARLKVLLGVLRGILGFCLLEMRSLARPFSCARRARGKTGRRAGEAVVPDIYKAGYATLHPVDTGAAIPIYPSLAEGTSERWARGEVQAHLDALRP